MRARTRGRVSSEGTALLSFREYRETPPDANAPAPFRRRLLEMAVRIESPPAEGHALNHRQSLARRWQVPNCSFGGVRGRPSTLRRLTPKWRRGQIGRAARSERV